MKGSMMCAAKWLVCLILVLAWGGRANAGLLYGLSTSATTSGLYTIDTTTGAATLVLNLPYRASAVGLTFLNGTLYASDVDVGAGGLRTGVIDLNTGAFTVISDQAGSNNWQGLAGNNAANVLYTANTSLIALNDLLAVTPTGVITDIGYPGLPARGLEYDNKHGILYAVTDDNLYTMDVATGAATLIGPTGIGFAPRVGLAYDEDNDTLYANVTQQLAPNQPLLHQLFQVNVNTGAFTLVGDNGLDVTIDGLAWGPSIAPVPEPSSFALVLFGTLTVLGCSYRTKWLSTLVQA